MPPNEPAQPDPFTDEDRARVDKTVLENLAWNIEQGNVIAKHGTMGPTVRMLREAASYIDHLEGALREIAKTSCFGTARGADSVEWRDHQKIARAALPTSKEGE